MKKKIVGIILCILVFIPVLAPITNADTGPEFELELKGGRALTLFITNIGDETTQGVDVHMEIVGGFILGSRVFDASLYLALEPTVTTSLPYRIYGLGRVLITISVDSENSEPAEITQGAVIIGRWIILAGDY